jgi:hypothetical protein
MNTSFAPQSLSPEDTAIVGPVRVGVAQKNRFAQRFAATLVASILLTGFATAAPQPARPDFAAVAHAIEAWFGSQPDYQPGDLITRSQIETVLKKLDGAGVHVPDAESIAKLGLANDSFLVRELTTPAGRTFMRKLARDPSTFAHLDRLSTIPRGETLIRDLIREKGGDKLVEYLATTKGGQRMGSMMASVPGGGDLNKPTGRIYTVADFEAALKAALAKASP